jgi:ATP-dependent Clp protease protease subunit
MTESRFQVNQKTGRNELYIYGDIKSSGFFEKFFGIKTNNSEEIVGDLRSLKGDIDVYINSYGGEVAEGLAIYNQLNNYGGGEIVTHVDGFACSAASIIYMAGSKRIMPVGSLLLIHNAWTSGSGDHNDFKKMAEDLEKITQPSVEIYADNSNLSQDKIKELMDKETWITAIEALEYGFATEVQKTKIEQSFDFELSKLVNDNKELKKINEELRTFKEKSLNSSTKKTSNTWNAYFAKGE